MIDFISKLFENSHVNEESFQKYAKFYGDAVPYDEEFYLKVNKIYDLIANKKESDIKAIAKEASCTDAECVLKIKYLKNKKLIGDYYIDTFLMKIYPCSGKDQELLEIYKPFIYGNHLSIDEMAARRFVATPKFHSVDDMKELVFNELKYLDSKNLINGIKLVDVDKKIVYYSVEKKKETNYKTVHCPNCGALNDVDEGNKTRCSYCNTIING